MPRCIAMGRMRSSRSGRACSAFRLLLNVDGLERKRKKWNRLAKAWYAISEWLATFCPTVVITDAAKIAEYYLGALREADSTLSPMAPRPGKSPSAEVLAKLGLERGGYFLYVSRMEPENNALLVREAFEKVSTPVKLALIGDAPYAQEYIQRVRDTRDPRVVMPGAIYGAGYHELQSHCLAYIHATEVGGTHPALIEAMGRGALVLYLNTPENAEVAGDAGIAFESGDLRQKLGEVLSMSGEERSEWGRKAAGRVLERYSWDAVTDQYEALADWSTGTQNSLGWADEEFMRLGRLLYPRSRWHWSRQRRRLLRPMAPLAPIEKMKSSKSCWTGVDALEREVAALQQGQMKPTSPAPGASEQAIIAPQASPERAGASPPDDNASRFTFHGYADVGFLRNQAGPSDDKRFSLGELDLFATEQLSPRLKALVEIVLETDSSRTGGAGSRQRGAAAPAISGQRVF